MMGFKTKSGVGPVPWVTLDDLTIKEAVVSYGMCTPRDKQINATMLPTLNQSLVPFAFMPALARVPASFKFQTR
jgi:hypothetical protein